ncbi:MAG: histidine kinase [Pseudobutyrivibrio sp.]|nr:histidine kinase [Pseudobutyrivibrio sp.]
MEFFAKKNISHQLRMLFIFAILIPILVVGNIIFFVIFKNIKTDYEHLSVSKADQINTALIMTSINIHQIQSTLVTDNTFMNILQKDNLSPEETKSKLADYNFLTNTLINTPSLSDLRIYVPKEKLEGNDSVNCVLPLSDEDINSEWYKRASEGSDGFFMTESSVNKNDIISWNLNYYSRITLPLTNEFAVMKATVSDDYLRSLIERDNYSIYISVDDDPVFFSSNRDYPGKEFPIDKIPVKSTHKESGINEILNKRTIYATTAIRPYKINCLIHVLVTNDSFYNQLTMIILYALILMLVIILISLLIIVFYGRYFVNRIRTLRLAMHKVSNNDYQIIDSIQGGDELSQTFEDLKNLVSELKEKEAEIYKGRIEEEKLINKQQQMELKLLAGQINPHFLYNTLEMIRMKSLTEGNRDVATAIKLLGKCMRYALNNTISTSIILDKELEYLNNYLSIMQMRFSDRLNYEVRVDDEINIYETQILPLLIQPIVENAIIHGLESTGNPGKLIIRINKTNDGNLKILVFDNGVGIKKEDLTKLRGTLTKVPNENAKHGIGMYNINSRIKKYYGEDFGVKIYSKYGFGTIVTATIPLRICEQENV